MSAPAPAVTAPVLLLTKNLNFYGGLDVQTGEIIDAHHPEQGRRITGRILATPGGEGSSSSPSALIECMRAGAGPAAIVTPRPDPVVAVAAYVYADLYGGRLVHAVLGPGAFGALQDGEELEVQPQP